ncbi:hypothetical protein [Reyranella sp.]|uniref:hypothetical protein n=1 Tax=Reyranella sp. TaxID=1929291 RepID=UPI003784BCD7
MAKKSTRKSAAKPHTLSFEQRLLQQLARAGRKVHRIDISNQLPIPDVVARELAPKIVAGDRIEFVQRGSDGREHVFAEWRWFVLFDAAMHRHGAPGWADAVISPLYIGQVHLEAGHWFAGYYRAADIVRGELNVHFHGAAHMRLSPAGSGRSNQDRWEPGQRHYDTVETMSFRDHRHGLMLGELTVAEMAFEAELDALAADEASQP